MVQNKLPTETGPVGPAAAAVEAENVAQLNSNAIIKTAIVIISVCKRNRSGNYTYTERILKVLTVL